jgi:HEAT repeat protein
MTLNKSQITVTRLVGLLAILGVIVWMWQQSELGRRPPTISTWVDKLQSRETDDRKYAVQELSNAGADHVAIVAPALIGALKDREVSVRNEAALALGFYVAAALKKQGGVLTDQSRAAASGLIEVIKNDADNSVRASAAFAVVALHRALRDAGINPDQSRADDPIDPKTMARAFNTVLEHDPATRLAILASYQSLGQIGEPAPPVLLAALEDPSSSVRSVALQTLSQFNSGADQAVPVLLKDAELKPPPRGGLQASKGAGPGAALLRAAEGLNPTAAVVPILAKALESQNPDVQKAAVVLLGRVGPDARSTSPALIAATNALIQSKSGEEKAKGPQFSDYASALVQILPAEEAVSVLGQAMGADHRVTRTAAATALGKLGPKGHAAVPILLKALKEAGSLAGGRADSAYTDALLQSLGQIAPLASLPHPMADEVVEALSRFLESPQGFIRITAAKALGDFGPRAAGALPKLRALGEDEKAPAAAREAASSAIEKIQPEKKSGDV